ncbi:MAG: DUF6265 family protein [Vicinamibacteria bacterium]
MERIAAAALVSLFVSPVLAADAPARVDDFAFAAGCWQAVAGDTTMEEQWSRPAGGVMLGLARVVSGGKTVFTEFVEVREKPEGLVMTVALGIGKPPTSFTRIAAAAGEVVFENKAHDFPQRVRYRNDGKDALFARVEGLQKGEAKGEDFPYRRVACP